MHCDDCGSPIEPGEQWTRGEVTHCACCDESIFRRHDTYRLATAAPYGVLLPIEAVRLMAEVY